MGVTAAIARILFAAAWFPAAHGATGGGRLLTQALATSDVRLVIAVGSRALAEVESRHAAEAGAVAPQSLSA
jgi:hypothetical protein